MLDIKFIEKNKSEVEESIRSRRLSLNIDELLNKHSELNKMRQECEDIKRSINEISAKFGKEKDESIKEKLAEQSREFKKRLQALETPLREKEEAFTSLLKKVPNIPTKDTPRGKDASENKVIKIVGKPKKFPFKPKTHWELGENLGVIDTERAVRISGTRFTYLLNELVLLEYALISFVLSVVTSERVLKKIIKSSGLKNVSPKPFIPVLPPMLVRKDVLDAMARLEPQDDRYCIPGDDLFLVGSAEHSLGPMHINEVLKEDELPLRYLGISSSFRREAGSYGRDMKGILRMHQFDKAEMESFTTSENSLLEHNFFTAIQEFLMQKLGIPYQVVLISTGDMGTPNVRQVDIESWFPGEQKYRETQTSDLMTDYQSRGLNTKVLKIDGKKEFVHMNDGTAFAIGRTIATIMENYQDKNGNIEIPSVLRPYMHGIKSIKKRA